MRPSSDFGLLTDDKPQRSLKFLELHQDITLNGVVIPAYTRLPALTSEKLVDGSVEIDKNAILLGLAEAVRICAKGEDLESFRKILLADKTLIPRLMKQVEGIRQDSDLESIRRNYHAIQLLRQLQGSELSYINQALALINMIHGELDDESHIEEMEDELFELLKEGLERYPDSYSLLFHMADYHKNAGNFELARKHLERLKESGRLGDQVDKLEKEISYYEEKKEKILYIYDLIGMSRTDDAIKSATDFLKNEKDDWHAHFLLGWAYRLKEDWENAERHLLESIRTGGGDFSECFNELSLAAWNLGKRELALKYIETAFDLDGKSISYACNAAMMSLELADFEGSLKHLQAAWRLDKDDEVLKALIDRYQKDSGEKFAYPQVKSAEGEDRK